MTPLCSIICPTRGRPDMLRRCITSLVEGCDDVSRIEIILRIHTDDFPTLAMIPELVRMGPVRIAIGHPLNGYGDLSRFYEEGIALAKGTWIWVMNDDVICETKGWDRMLAGESSDHIVMPEVHKLGGSVYRRDLETPFMWVPNGCWWPYLPDRLMPTPFDIGLWSLLRRHGWQTSFLKDMMIHHQRDDAEVAARRREELEAIYPEEQCRH